MPDPVVAPVAPVVAPVVDPAAAPAAFDWAKAGGLADTNLGYVQSKGFKDPGALLSSYINLEKLVGGGLDSVIKLPTDGVITPEIYDRLGRPKDVKGYEVDKWVPQGADKKFAETAATWFHENGLNTKQAGALVAKWNEYGAQATKAQNDATAARDATQTAALKQEWGANFDANATLVEKAADAFGMTKDHLVALKTAMGPAAAMKFMHNLGSKLGASDNFVTGEQRQQNFNGGMSVEQARSEKQALMADKGWVAKWTAGDKDARQKMATLNKVIAPGTLTNR